MLHFLHGRVGAAAPEHVLPDVGQQLGPDADPLQRQLPRHGDGDGQPEVGVGGRGGREGGAVEHGQAQVRRTRRGS